MVKCAHGILFGYKKNVQDNYVHIIRYFNLNKI